MALQLHGDSLGTADLTTAASSPHSARQAIVELQLRSSLLNDEIRYYETLHSTSRVAYEDHRNELDDLVSKERRYIARREAILQERLQSILAEKSTLQYRLGQDQQRVSSEISVAVEQTREDALMYERKIQSDLETVHLDLQQEREKLEKALADHQRMLKATEEAKRRQKDLLAEVKRLKEENERLLREKARKEEFDRALRVKEETERELREAQNDAAAEQHQRSKSISPRRMPPPPVRTQHPFIPVGSGSSRAAGATTGGSGASRGVAGGGNKSRKGVSFGGASSTSHYNQIGVTTHNAHALLQTARRQSFRRSPPRDTTTAAAASSSRSGSVMAKNSSSGRSASAGGGRPPAHASSSALIAHASDAHQLESIGRSIAQELNELYFDYERVSQHLSTPAGPSPMVAAKLRSIFEDIEHKAAQLQRLRASQARHEESERFVQLMRETEDRNRQCASKYKALMDVIHSDMFHDENKKIKKRGGGGMNTRGASATTTTRRNHHSSSDIIDDILFHHRQHQQQQQQQLLGEYRQEGRGGGEVREEEEEEYELPSHHPSSGPSSGAAATLRSPARHDNSTTTNYYNNSRQWL